MNHYAIILALIVILTLGLRLYNLGLDSLWLDESFSVVISQNHDFTRIIELTNNDIHPPLYYLILHFFVTLPGQIEVLARIPSVILGTLTVIPLYLMARELFDKKVAIVTAILYAVSFTSITYSQEARMYPMVLFLGAIQIYYFYRAMKKNRLTDWIVFAISSVLIVYTHYYGIVLTGSLALYGLFISYHRDSWKAYKTPAFKNLIICLAIICLAFLPQLPVAYHQSTSDVANSEINPDNMLFYPRLIYFLTACGVKNPRTLFALVLTAVFLTLSIVSIIINWSKKSDELSYLMAIFAISSLSCLILSNMVRFCGFRYIIFLLVPYLTLTANGIVSLVGIFGKHKAPAIISTIAVILLILVNGAFIVSPLYSGANVDLRDAMQYVKDHSGPDDRIAILNSDQISGDFYACLLGMERQTITNASFDYVEKISGNIQWVIISDDKDLPANAKARPWLNEHMRLYANLTRVSVYGIA